MVNALYATPAWLLLCVACLGAITVAVSGQRLVHGRFRDTDFIQHNEVGGFTIAVIGTLYAVIVAFVVAIVWQEYDVSQTRVGLEAAAGATVWHEAEGLPEPLAARTRAAMVEFARLMIDEEWPDMRRGGASRRAETLVVGALHDVARFRPSNLGESNVQSHLLTRLSAVHDARHQRLRDNASGLSWFEWTVLIVGGVVVIGFCYLFGLQNQRVHRLMTAALAGIITMACVLIFELDYPFRGDLGVSPEPWRTFLQAIGA